MIRIFRWLSIAILVIPCAAAAKDAQLDDWYVGGGFGFGNGYYELDGEKITFRDRFAGAENFSQTSFNLKGGWRTNNPNMLVGIDFTSVVSRGAYPGVSARLSLSNLFVVGTWFPSGPNIFFRGGGGISTLTLDINNAISRVRGAGVLLGAGSYWRLRESFGLSVNLDVTRSRFNAKQNQPKAAGAILLYLGFDWY